MNELLTVPTYETYPKSVRSRLQQTFNKAQLPLVGGSDNGVIARDTQYSRGLPPSPFSGELSPEAAAFGVRYPHILDSLLVQPQEKSMKYIAGIGGHDYQRIPAIAKDIALQEGKEKQVALRTVFGGTPEMQFRGLSMLLPGLQVLQKMSELNHGTITPPELPQLQIIFANHIAASLNGFNYASLATQSRRMIDLSQEYIQAFFPNLSKDVVFLEDSPFENGSYLASEMQRLASLADKYLPQHLQEKVQGKRQSIGDTGLSYAAAHLLVHDTNDERLLRPVNGNTTSAIIPKAIISIGGRQEQDFYNLRHAIRPYAGSDYQIPTAQIFTKHGSAPYYPARAGDISLDAVINGVNPRSIAATLLDPHAVFDINYFYAVSDNRGDTDAFINHIQERKAV